MWFYLIYFPTGNSSVDFEDTIQSSTSSGNLPTLVSDDGTSWGSITPFGR